jgi:hypothetical protein
MPVSEILRHFIATHIDSVDQLEILLLLKRNFGRSWSSREVGGTLFTSSDTAATHLAGLAVKGLLTVGQNGDETTYRYDCRDAKLDLAVSDLERLYPKHPVTIISSIFAKPSDKIRPFESCWEEDKDE